jgi:AraC-like DNA-binding protein
MVKKQETTEKNKPFASNSDILKIPNINDVKNNSRYTKHYNVLSDYFRNNYSKKGINLSIIAKEIGLSLYYLSLLCDNYFGMSVMQCIGSYRIHAAVELIFEGKNHIWALVGFTSPITFSRSFKRKTGMTKRELKAKILNLNEKEKKELKSEIINKIWGHTDL